MINRFTIVSFFLLTVSCFSQQQFTSGEYGISITFPDGWYIQRGTTNMVVVIAWLNSTTTINIAAKENEDWKNYTIEQVDPENFAGYLKKLYADNFEKFKAVDYGRTKVNDYPALYFSYKFEHDNSMYRAKQYFLFRENLVYVISIGCLDSESATYLETLFIECLNTFSFTK